MIQIWWKQILLVLMIYIKGLEEIVSSENNNFVLDEDQFKDFIIIELHNS